LVQRHEKTIKIHKNKAPKTGKTYEKEQVTIYDLPCTEVQNTKKQNNKIGLGIQ